MGSFVNETALFFFEVINRERDLGYSILQLGQNVANIFESKSHGREEQIVYNTLVYVLGQFMIPRTLSIADSENLRPRWLAC